MRLVNLETPYAAPTPKEVEENKEYARACLLDSLRRGEAPLASHLLYTQALDDLQPEERTLGIRAGFAWNEKAEATVVYVDRGISRGMQMGIDEAESAGRRVEYRRLDWAHGHLNIL